MPAQYWTATSLTTIEGAGWDDEPEAPVAGMGHNLPDDPCEAMTIEFASEKELADALLKKPITTQDEADKAGILAKRIAAIGTKAEAQFKVEKQPSLDEGRRIDTKWRPLKEELGALSKKLKAHIEVFLKEEQCKERERQAAAQAEANRIAREAEEARLAAERAAEAQEDAGMHDIAAIAERNNTAAEAERLEEQAAQAQRDAQARNVSAGRTGARVSLHTFVYAEILDFDKLLIALKDRQEIRELVETLANRAARSGVDLDGMAIRSEQRAA